MPIDNTIALQAKAPEFNPLAQMLQVRQYQNQTLQGNQLQAALNAKQAIGQAYANNTQNGVVNLQSAMQDAASNPSSAYGLPEAASTNLDQQSKTTANASAQLGLSNEQQQHLVQQMGTLLNQPKVSYADAVQTTARAGETYGLSPQVVQRALAGIPTEPEQIKPYLKQKLAALQPAGAQLATNTPSPTIVNNGATQQTIDTNPNTNPGIIGTSVTQQLPPTTPTFDPQTNAPGYLGPHPTMSIRGMTAAPGGMNVAPSAQQGMNAQSLQLLQQERATETNPANQAMLDREIARVQATVSGKAAQAAPIQSGPALDTSELMAIRTSANQAAAGVGDSRNNNDQIRQILTQTKGNFADPTGALAKNFAHLSSYTGFHFGVDGAENFNSITHYLALQQQTRNQQMGVSTDAGSKISGVSSGSPDQDRKTLTNAVNISDAGNTGMEKYNAGLEAAIKQNGIASVRDFKNAWSQNYDVNALRLVNAKQRGDVDEAKDIVKQLGGVNSKQYALARQHIIVLDALSQGQLPTQGK